MIFINCLEDEMNVSFTENGMKGYAATKDALVDFNFSLPAIRNMSDELLHAQVAQLLNDKKHNKEVIYRYMFFLRDVRGGLGERRIFREMLKELANREPELVKHFIKYIVEVGRWDDLFVLMETPLKKCLIETLCKQLEADWDNMQKDKPISLLAKWMPSINSGKKSRKLAREFIGYYGMANGEYRKALSEMRKYLDIVEQHISNNTYNEIDYEAVPSKANKKYAELFMRKDMQRRQEYLDSLSKGKAKINASTLYPHEIISMVRRNSDKRLTQGLWENLKDYEGVENTLVVADVSGSMAWGSNNIMPIDCSVGLALYFAQRAKDEFKGKVVTFSDKPAYVDVSRFKTVYDAYIWMTERMDWNGSTNIEAVFKLVLDTAARNKLKQEDIPNILIISDMEFNECTYGNSFEAISELYRSYGYKLPKLIFWNAASRSGTIPVIENENGLVLVSGYSPAAIKAAASSETYDPLKAIYDCIYVERYNFVREVLEANCENSCAG